MEPTSQIIRGYAGGMTRAYGTVNVNLTVDLVTNDVGIFVVHEDIQLIPIIIRHIFLKRTNVTIVIRNNQVRLIQRKKLSALPEIGEPPHRKIRYGQKRRQYHRIPLDLLPSATHEIIQGMYT
jgi:hypothetical protein